MTATEEPFDMRTFHGFLVAALICTVGSGCEASCNDPKTPDPLVPPPPAEEPLDPDPNEPSPPQDVPKDPEVPLVPLTPAEQPPQPEGLPPPETVPPEQAPPEMLR